MTLTLLIDLDDTLLTNSMDDFLPAYIGALANHMAPYVEAEKWIGQLMAATQTMRDNDRPDKTLKERFDEDFYPVLGLDHDAMQPPLENFYQEIFPSLKPVTEERPDAVEMVMRAVEKGYQIAIATNPLFPPLAILHRLDWAGLSAKEFNFTIVPSYETFHFAKPNPAYYAELLAQMGWPEGPVVMVGNDPITDIRGAQELGLATFWVTHEEQAEHSFVMDGKPMAASGWLDKVLPWIEKSGAEQLMPQFETTTAITAILRSTPAAASTLLKNIPVENWKTRPSESEWSLCEILCHLRDVDLEINIPRVKTILAEDNPFIEAVDSDAWAVEREYQKQDAAQGLESYIQARMNLLGLIFKFGEQEWQETARHSIFGPTTMKELLKITSRHDRLHMQQIYENCQILKK